MITDEPGTVPAKNINNPGSAYNEALRCIQISKLEAAVSYLQRTVELEPEFTDAHYDLGVLYYQLGRLEEASKEYKIVLALRPRDVDALNNLSTIVALCSNLEEAKKLFDIAMAIDPEFALTHRNLAAYYNRKGDVEKTAWYVRRAKELDKEVFDREPGPPRIKSGGR